MGALAVTRQHGLALAEFLRWVLVFIITCFATGEAFSAESDISAAPLRAKYTALDDQLRNNQFQRALYLNSVESSHDLKGEIYAVVNYPFATVNAALNKPENWCDVLILHINIKYCHASISEPDTIFTVNLGKKEDQPLADTYRVEFNYRGVATTPDYFALELNAENGPLSTHDYHIWVEATPLKGGRTFLHFTYAYAFGLPGRLAMQGYLATIGRDKVGFTVTEKLPDGKPKYIRGVRGVVERNTMRYYLAIEAFLGARSTPAEARVEKSLRDWYSATERYSRQLHEIERADYMAMKHKEYSRQRSDPVARTGAVAGTD